MLERNKKNLIVTIVTVVVVIVIGAVAGVVMKNVIDRQSDDDDEGNAIVRLNYHPDGYSENPASSIIVAEFASEIRKKMRSDSEYTYDNAISDYEIACNNARSDVKTDIIYGYAQFVFDETKDINKAKEILKRIEDSELNGSGVVRYYTTLTEMCKALGMEEEANRYIELREKAVPSVDVFIDGASESMEEE